MGEKSSGRSAAPRVHHLALRTRDVDGLARFYRELIGLEEVRAERPRSVWLGLGGGAVLMLEARGEAEPAVPHGSLELFAFRVSDERKHDVRAAAMAGGCFDGETAYTVYLRDPDGRRVAVSTHPLTDGVLDRCD